MPHHMAVGAVVSRSEIHNRRTRGTADAAATLVLGGLKKNQERAGVVVNLW